MIPGWQFHIQPVTDIFPSCAVNLNSSDGLDKRYETKSAQLADNAYCLWNRGELLCSKKADIVKLKQLPPPTLKDEYIFIRKYWGYVWSIYVLIFRLACFKNPVKELKSFFSTRHINKFDTTNVQASTLYANFKSSLIDAAPLIAVIIPTLNRYEYLKDALKDLEEQKYKNIEVIVVDQSDQFDDELYKSFNLNIKVIRQQEKELWTARNKAVEITEADYLLFFDDDSRVSNDWVIQHLKCIDYFNADISAGVSLSVIGSKIPENYNCFRWADQFDSGNAMVKREVFQRIGLFDEQFNGLRMGDGEFGFRCYKNGYKSISNPLASRVHYKASGGGLREMGSWDGFRPKKWFAPKPIPSVLFLYKKYLPNHLFKHAILKGIILSNVPYKYKSSSKMLVLSILLSIIKLPLLYLQYKKAEKIALQMLKKDNGIWLLKDSIAQHAI